MKSPPVPDDEAERLDTLRQYCLLDTAPDPSLDDLTALARHICGAPIALISLVDQRRQWFKSKSGFDFKETPREDSFCAHAIVSPDLLVVPNALEDERFVDNPLVTGSSAIRFYAGMPLAASNGRILGTLCVMDVHPRQLQPAQRQALEILGRQVVAQFELGRNSRELSESRARAGGFAASVRTSEQRYRALFERAPDGILIADPQSYYLDANETMCQMLGYTRAELIGMHARDIVDLDEMPYIDPALKSIQATSDYRREWRFRRKDRSVFAADVRVNPMPDGNLLAMVRDVTERNQASEALRLAEERMRFALQSSGVGIWDMDYKTGVLRWSETLEAHYGLAPGSFGGTYTDFTNCIHPEDLESVQETVTRATEAGTDFKVLSRALWADGTIRWLAGAGRVYLDEKGQPSSAIGISQDITERRILEAQFQQAQKMEAVGRLAGSVAHDFNNLLTAILGYCELLLETEGPESADLREIQKAGTSAATLTGQLLAFSRKQIIKPMLLDLNLVVDEMHTMLERLIGEDIRVHLALGPPAPVEVDRGQMEQVFMNLALNARDAMPQGGTLTIETGELEVELHNPLSLQPGAYVTLTVADTGQGMSAEVQSRVFEPFFTTKEMGRGTGLGLATVHGIVTQSGGGVSVTSHVGRGTTFKVYLPRAENTQVAAEVPAAPRTPAGPCSVLVVDDTEGPRELARRLLERHGYKTLVAANSEQAVQLFEQSPVDVLLTDVMMPGTNGAVLAARLTEICPTLKVIYMSGYTEEAIVNRGVLNPGVVLLHKPFSADSLLARIHDVMG